MRSTNTLKISMLILGCAVGLAALGCYVSAAVPGVGAEFEVGGPPPPIQEEAVIAAPGPDYVWIGGYWDWDVGVRQYVWRAGRWDHPPHAEAHWIAPHYEMRSGRHYYHPGHWDRHGDREHREHGDREHGDRDHG